MAERIAVASIDGSYIDQHFGSARYWQIYDIDDTAEFVETRKAIAMCKGHCEGGFEDLIELLNDCDAVFVSKIGIGAAGFMIGHGKRVFEVTGEVQELLTELECGYLTYE
jgi:predicted Fe-Mo cluster-binding NifX family protein